MRQGRLPDGRPRLLLTQQPPPNWAQVRQSLCAQLSFKEPSPAAPPDNRWAAAPQARPRQALTSCPQPSTKAPPGRGARSYLRHVGRATGSHRRGGSWPEPGCAPGPRGSRCCLRRRFGGNAQEPPERATTPRSAPSRRGTGGEESGGRAQSRERAVPRPPSPGSARGAGPGQSAREVRKGPLRVLTTGTHDAGEEYLLFYRSVTSEVLLSEKRGCSDATATRSTKRALTNTSLSDSQQENSNSHKSAIAQR